MFKKKRFARPPGFNFALKYDGNKFLLDAIILEVSGLAARRRRRVAKVVCVHCGILFRGLNFRPL
jgi:hypothetical protein